MDIYLITLFNSVVKVGKIGFFEFLFKFFSFKEVSCVLSNPTINYEVDYLLDCLSDDTIYCNFNFINFANRVYISISSLSYEFGSRFKIKNISVSKHAFEKFAINHLYNRTEVLEILDILNIQHTLLLNLKRKIESECKVNWQKTGF